MSTRPIEIECARFPDQTISEEEVRPNQANEIALDILQNPEYHLDSTRISLEAAREAWIELKPCVVRTAPCIVLGLAFAIAYTAGKYFYPSNTYPL